MQAMAAGQAEIDNGSNAQVKTDAKNAAPIVAAHHTLLDAAARALGIPSSIGTGTGGQAATRLLTTPVLTLLAIGLMLVLAAGLLLSRRRPGAVRG